MKRIIALLGCLLIVLLSVCPCFAYDLPNADYFRTVDGAGLFTEDQIEELETRIRDSIERNGMDLVILTNTTDEGMGWMDYADSFYDSAGFGLGQDHSGILLFLCMEDGNRGFWTSTSGRAMPYFTEANQNYIDDCLYDFLVNGYYYEGICDYIDNVNHLYVYGDFKDIAPSYYNSGEYQTEYDPDYYTDEHSYTGTEPYDSYPKGRIIGGFGLFSGLLSAAASGFGLKRSMKTVSVKKKAGNFVAGQNLTLSNDIYLGTSVSRRVIQTENRSSGGGHMHSSYSGGHHSSGGGFHGGGGRRF